MANSLRNRFEIWKEAIQNSDFETNFRNGQEVKISLPSRVIFSYETIRLCDYKDHGESLQVD